VDVVVVVTPVSEAVNHRRIAVECEDHRNADRKQQIEFLVRQPMRMLGLRLQGHQVHYVDHANAQVGYPNARSRLTAARASSVGTSPLARHHYVGVAFVVRGPWPDAESGGAVSYSLVDGEPLRFRLLAGYDQVDVVLAAQAVVGY
jgi:hypothetical protein